MKNEFAAASDSSAAQLEIDLRDSVAKPGSELELAAADQAGQPTTSDGGDSAPDLTDLELRILEFEHRWYRRRGVKHVALSREFGMSPIRYFQILNQIIDKPDAIIVEPTLVNRLRRLRDSRRRMHRPVRTVLSA